MTAPLSSWRRPSAAMTPLTRDGRMILSLKLMRGGSTPGVTPTRAACSTHRDAGIVGGRVAQRPRFVADAGKRRIEGADVVLAGRQSREPELAAVVGLGRRDGHQRRLVVVGARDERLDRRAGKRLVVLVEEAAGDHSGRREREVDARQPLPVAERDRHGGCGSPLAVLLRRVAAPRRGERIRAGRQVLELVRAVGARQRHARFGQRGRGQHHARARERRPVGAADDRPCDGSGWQHRLRCAGPSGGAAWAVGSRARQLRRPVAQYRR